VGRLRRADCSGPGFRRRRRGRGFEYLDERGRPLADAEALERIRELAIPPAWKDVWICPDPNGHLQATGIDAAGRKQYLYHAKWRARRDQQKFDQMVRFARALPGMRKVVADHLAREELDRERVLACAVRLLDRGFFRIGSEDYAEENETYGLATIRKEHVSVNGKEITFDYPAKGGQRRVQSILDPEVKTVVSELKRRRSGGPELLAYRNGRSWVDLGSSDINEYIKTVAGEDFTAKDFRTWSATVIAAVALAASAENGAVSKTARKRVVTNAVKGVAEYLGNTPAVCRASYIDPRVFDRYLSGWTISLAGEPDLVDLDSRTRIEAAVLDLIEERDESSKVEKVG
jgi:DNA topoisomerase I